MVRVADEILIARPVEEVFDLVADQRNEPCYNPDMVRAEKLTPGPVGLGTRFRADTRSGRRTVAMTMEITEYDRPRRLAWSIHMSAMDIRGTVTLDPVPGGTRMRWSWDLRPRGATRLLTPVVAALGRRMERRIWTSMKRYLEGQAPSSAAEVSR